MQENNKKCVNNEYLHILVFFLHRQSSGTDLFIKRKSIRRHYIVRDSPPSKHSIACLFLYKESFLKSIMKL